MTSVDVELALVALAAMLSPTTLFVSILVLALGDRPLRSGVWFYLGALGVTLAIGVVAALVLGNAATSHTSTPKTWVAVVDVVAGALVLAYVVRALRRPVRPERVAGMVERMGKVASSPAVAIVGAGATLANPEGSSLSLSRTSRSSTPMPGSSFSIGSSSRWCRCFRSGSRS